MIGWITEPDRREAVLLSGTRNVLTVLGQECMVFQEQGTYRIRLPRGLLYVRNPLIEHEAVTVIRQAEREGIAVIYWSMYENVHHRFRRISWEKPVITLGSSIDDDIYIQDANLQPSQFLIDRSAHMITDRFCSGIGDCDGKPADHSAFHNGSRFSVLNTQILLNDAFLAVSCVKNCYLSMADAYVKEGCLPADTEPFVLERAYYETVPELRFETELREPLPFEETRSRPLLFLMGPALTMAFASMATGILSAYNGWLNGREFHEILPMLILPCVMVFSALLWNPLQRFHERRQEKTRRKERLESYRKYLDELCTQIESKQNHAAERMEELFPASYIRVKALYRALPGRPDYMMVRLGSGQVPFESVLHCSFHPSVTDPIPGMIQQVATKYETVQMPVTADLHDCFRIAVQYDSDQKQQAVRLISQLLFYHGPDIMKLVILCTRKFEQEHPWLRELPHLSLKDGTRLIVTSIQESCAAVRALHHEEPKEILLLCMNRSLLSVFEELPAKVIYLLNRNPLPLDMDCLIRYGQDPCIIRNGRVQRFVPDRIQHGEYGELLNLFSRCRIVQNSSKLSSRNTFLDLYRADTVRSLNLLNRWKIGRTSESIRAWIGIGEDGEPVGLDLHERGNGPHGLIAGMTGSGKSELIITLLLSLCVNYSPREFQFVMVDFKGGGAVHLFSNASYRIPHCAGSLSNLDEADMERALVSFQNECLRRENLFSKLSTAAEKSVMNLSQYQTVWKPEYDLPYLPALLIIVDEFAELRKERPDAMKDLISIARVGRSLGIHMILATQKPGGIVDEQIWSNCRFKICLKVQEKADSSEMIHCPDAAWISRPGEGFVLCDGILTHVQCGYANAPADRMSRVAQLLDAMGNTIRKVEFPSHGNAIQSEEIIGMILEASADMEPAVPLWCEPITHVRRSDLPEQNENWIGIADDYRNHRQIPYSVQGSLMAVFSIDRDARCLFMRTLLSAFLNTAEEDDFLIVVDDAGITDSILKECRSVIGVLRSSQEEQLGNALSILERRTEESSGTASLILSDIAAFSEADESNRIRLHRLIRSAERTHVRIILFSTTSTGIPYRDLSMIPLRIALKTSSTQELSSIFEKPVHYPVSHLNTALVSSLHDPLDLYLIETEPEELESLIRNLNIRYGTEKPCRIPFMPSCINMEEYAGDEIPLGKDLFTYEWVCMPNAQRLFVLATYEEELYDFYELMKEKTDCYFMNDGQNECGIHGFLFLTAEKFHTAGIRQSDGPILYIGSGFREQYRFTAKYRKELKANQAILFQTGKNRVLQLCERRKQ
ncbi:MAG: hypothetical protein IKS32_00685 [Solobacterium sp.]|nr:hypothetical protein [Solobacterium sp.]